MSRLLITGAYGLVGSNICKILERDYPDVEITKVKFDEMGEMGLFAQEYDFVVHAAGYGQPIKFSQDKTKTIWTNTFLTESLFTYLRPKGSFLFVSSSEVYSGAQPLHKETDIGTTTPQHPRACYIESKRCGEAICMAYKEQGYDVKIARLALAYGPGTKKSDTRVINQFIEQAITTGKIVMKDQGMSWRTYIYVEDAARLMLDILFKGKDVVYNVGGFSSLSIRSLADEISFKTGAQVIAGEFGLDGAPDNVSLNMLKTLNEFGGTFVPFDEGIKKTIEYQKTLYAGEYTS